MWSSYNGNSAKGQERNVDQWLWSSVSTLGALSKQLTLFYAPDAPAFEMAPAHPHHPPAQRTCFGLVHSKPPINTALDGGACLPPAQTSDQVSSAFSFYGRHARAHLCCSALLSASCPRLWTQLLPRAASVPLSPVCAQYCLGKVDLAVNPAHLHGEAAWGCLFLHTQDMFDTVTTAALHIDDG